MGLSLVLASCQSGGASPRVPLEVPNAVTGGTRGGGRPDSPSVERMNDSNAIAQADRDAKAAAEKEAKAAKAEALWNSAGAQAANNDFGDAADDYTKIADEHPDSIHAIEARYLAAVNFVADEDWNPAVAALMQYMTDFPVNPHLREVERMLFDSSIRVIDGATGFKGIFKSDQKGFEGLKAVVERFPEGDLPDDALMRLGPEYAKKDDDSDAALAYRELLMKYPNSEHALEARLRLADTYLSRDQGAAYHAGYVDLDPRGPKSPQYAQGRPIVSCVESALATYRLFLTEDRPRASAAQIAYAEGMVSECQNRLAAKDRSISSYYAGKGDPIGASTYARRADNVEAGRAAGEVLPPPIVPGASMTGPSPSGGTPGASRSAPPPFAPPPATPRVATPPVTPPPAVPPPAVPPPYVPPPYVPPPYVPPPYVPPPGVPPRYLPPPSQVPPFVPPPALPPATAVTPPAAGNQSPANLPPPRHIQGSLSPDLPK